MNMCVCADFVLMPPLMKINKFKAGRNEQKQKSIYVYVKFFRGDKPYKMPTENPEEGQM